MDRISTLSASGMASATELTVVSLSNPTELNAIGLAVPDWRVCKTVSAGTDDATWYRLDASSASVNAPYVMASITTGLRWIAIAGRYENQTLTSAATIAAKPNTTAGIAIDPNAATGDFLLSLSPANLTAARRWSFPDRSDTVAGLGAQTFAGAQTVGTLQVSGTSGPGFKITAVSGYGFVALNNDTTFTGTCGFMGGASGDSTLYLFAPTGFPIDTRVNNVTCLRVAGALATSFVPLLISDTTASTSTTTGALVVTGGVGVGGRLNVGGDITADKTGANVQCWVKADDANQAGFAFYNRSVSGLLLYRPASATSLNVFSTGASADVVSISNSAIGAGSLSLNYTTDATTATAGAFAVAGGIAVAKRLCLDGATGKTLKYVNGVANAAVAVLFGAIGPTGSTAGNAQGWIRIDIAGTDRYIPYW